ncbi:carboxylesterase 3B-like [Dermacentor variabilis]|uniref:carboxylesterase 3B-like n=1 Tax=Dermacentor variabilis TaxID=34621 RepID=UPI003F5AE8C4
MDAPDKPGGETSMSAQAEEHTESKSRKGHRRHKPRDGKRRGTSSSDDGAGKSADSAASHTPSSSKTQKHSSKSPDKGAPESQKPPEAAPASTAALPSHTSTTQDAPKPPAAKLATKGGRLVGRTVSVGGVALTRFLGVPFAQSTAGLRRFLVPLPMGPPQDPCAVLEHLEPRPPCAQWSNGSVIGSEDCLHVNVWMPAAMTGGNGSGGGRVLVVAVSGSWFETGSNDDPDWPQLAAKGERFATAYRGVLCVMRCHHVLSTSL